MRSLDDRLEEDLVKEGLLDAASLAEIKDELQRSGKNAPPLRQFLISRGLVHEERILALQAARMNIPFMLMDGLSPEASLVTTIP